MKANALKASELARKIDRMAADQRANAAARHAHHINARKAAISKLTESRKFTSVARARAQVVKLTDSWAESGLLPAHMTGRKWPDAVCLFVRLYFAALVNVRLIPRALVFKSYIKEDYVETGIYEVRCLTAREVSAITGLSEHQVNRVKRWLRHSQTGIHLFDKGLAALIDPAPSVGVMLDLRIGKGIMLDLWEYSLGKEYGVSRRVDCGKTYNLQVEYCQSAVPPDGTPNADVINNLVDKAAL